MKRGGKQRHSFILPLALSISGRTLAQMPLKRSGARYFAQIKARVHLCAATVPPVDLLFCPASALMGKNCVGVIIILWVQWCRGMAVMKEAGSVIIAQDEKSCVVFGMLAECEGDKNSSACPLVSFHLKPWRQQILRFLRQAESMEIVWLLLPPGCRPVPALKNAPELSFCATRTTFSCARFPEPTRPPASCRLSRVHFRAQGGRARPKCVERAKRKADHIPRSSTNF